MNFSRPALRKCFNIAPFYANLKHPKVINHLMHFAEHMTL